MIPTRIDHKGDNDNYRALALYIADATIGTDPSEKTLHSWYIGVDADNYLEGMIEVEAIQDQKPDIEKKTYHLVVSFRPEDDLKLTKEVLLEIETMLAAALGYSDHQRHCGVHVNTDNLHMHIAFNRINPKTLNAHNPYYDFPKLHRACRMIEQKFGLAVDKGMEPDFQGQEPKANAKVRTLEAQTGQESFYNYVLRHKDDINLFLSQAESWHDIHQGFLKLGLILKLSGNGLTIKDRYAKHYAKPSAIDRAFSKQHLVEKFGVFQEPSKDQLRDVQATETYTARPLHKGAKRGGLYDLYLEEMQRRNEAVREIKEEGQRTYQTAKNEWHKKKAQIKKIPMLAADRQRVMNNAKIQETMELEKIRKNTRGKLDEIRKKRPYTSWVKFLQHQASEGNETALAILRSKQLEVQPEGIKDISTEKPFSSKLPWLEDRSRALSGSGVMSQNQKSLLCIANMREVLRETLNRDAKQAEFNYNFDSKGIVIFNLKGIGIIRDTGTEIHYRGSNTKIKDLAIKYAGLKYGKNIELGPGKITRKPYKSTSIEDSNAQSRGR